jgi:hypothetical protein
VRVGDHASHADAMVAGHHDLSSIDGGSILTEDPQCSGVCAGRGHLPQIDGLRSLSERANDKGFRGSTVHDAEVDDQAVAPSPTRAVEDSPSTRFIGITSIRANDFTENLSPPTEG